MNTLTCSTRLCILLLFFFGLLISEVAPTQKIVSANSLLNVPAANPPAAPAGVQELLTDDGGPEITLGGAGLLCVNRLTPVIYPATLQTIRIFLIPVPPIPAGTQIKLIAFAGPQGSTQPPNTPSLLVNQTVTIPSLPPAGKYIDFPIQNGPTISSGDFYVGFQVNSEGGAGFVGDLTGQPQRRAFSSTDNGKTFQGPLTVSNGAPVNLMVRAVVADDRGLDTLVALGFDYVNPGASVEQGLTVSNSGDTEITITGVTISDPQFAAAPLPLPLALAPHMNTTIRLRFTPASPGAKNATLTITSNDPARPSLNVPLSGIGGQPAPELTIFAKSGAAQTGSIIAPPAPTGSGVIAWPEYAVFVPAGASELKIDLSGNQDLDLFARFNQPLFLVGSGGGVADYTSKNPGVTPESITITLSSSPPLRAGLYYIAIANRGPGAADFNLTATVTGGTAPGAATAASAASFSAAELASESIVAAFGSGLATSSKSAESQPLPTNLAGTTIKIRDNFGFERLAPLFFVSSQQVNFYIPLDTALGTVFLTFTSGDGSLSTGVAKIASVAPGLFTANSSGNGLAVSLALRVTSVNAQTYEPTLRFDSAQNQFVPVPIDLGGGNESVFLLLFGTGIHGAGNLSRVTATVGGVSAPVTFAGAISGFTGLDQLNLGPLPRSLAGRGEVDVVINVDGKPANTVKIVIK